MRVIIFGFIVFGLASCSKYQFVTINSDFEKTKKGTTITENDTIAVTYAFSGVNGQARIQLINKLSVPIYVRWRPFSLVKQTWPTSKPTFSASTETVSFENQIPEYNRVENGEEVLTIAPYSVINSRSIALRRSFFHISTPEMKNGELNGDIVRSQYFSRQNTPLMFVSDFEFSTTQDFQQSSQFKHEFWVDEVFVTMIKPEKVPSYKGRDDMFYLQKGSGLGVVLASLGVFTYIAASKASD